MGNDGLKGLVSSSGQPLTPEPRFIIIKQPKHVRLDPRMIQGIRDLTKCSIIVLPMDCEIMMGKIAKGELDSIHTAIHTILDSLNQPTK